MLHSMYLCVHTVVVTENPSPPVQSGPRGVVDQWTGPRVKMDPGPQPYIHDSGSEKSNELCSEYKKGKNWNDKSTKR